MSSLGGVREYNRIRRYLEHIYLYGFFSREDFAQAGIGSVKDYDYGIRLLRALFPDTEDSAVWNGGRKYLRIQREYACSGEDRMAGSYLLYTMDTEDELPSLLGVLSSLAGGPKTIQEICRDTAIHTQVNNELNYHTVRRWLLELVEYGYGTRTGQRYALQANPMAQLSDEGVLQLYDYVRFAAGVTYPRVAGSFLQRSLERELLARGHTPTRDSPFLLRHSVSRNVFDEEILYCLMQAIAQRKLVTLDRGGDPWTVQPVAVRVDGKLGRWYLLAQGETPTMIRISGIQEARPGPALSQEDWEQGRQACLSAFAQSGCSGALGGTGPVQVRASLHFETAPGLKSQFLRELRMGGMAAEGESTQYQAAINDPVELTAFLRGYSPWLRVEPGDHNLDQQIRQDLLQMREQLQREGPL